MLSRYADLFNRIKETVLIKHKLCHRLLVKCILKIFSLALEGALKFGDVIVCVHDLFERNNTTFGMFGVRF